MTDPRALPAAHGMYRTKLGSDTRGVGGKSSTNEKILSVRLTSGELEAIKRTSRRIFGDSAVVRLFGSRVDPARQGGDIDLHIEVDDDVESWRAKANFEQDLFSLIDEQRVDVVIHCRNSPMRAIDVIAHERGVVL